jgi:LEA14-like dessication related protein
MLLVDVKPLQIAVMKANDFWFMVLGAGILTGTFVTIYKRLKKLKEISVKPELGTFKIVSISSKTVTCLINVTIINPTDISVNIKKLNLQVFFQNKLLSEIYPIKAVLSANSNATFIIPFDIQLSAFYSLSQAFISQSTLPLLFKGTVSAQAIIQISNMPFSFSIDAKEQIQNAGQLNGIKL